MDALVAALPPVPSAPVGEGPAYDPALYDTTKEGSGMGRGADVFSERRAVQARAEQEVVAEAEGEVPLAMIHAMM